MNNATASLCMIVIRLQQIGIHETVGNYGTALTMDQIQEIRELCNSITSQENRTRMTRILAER